jgi:MEMO1 family protein
MARVKESTLAGRWYAGDPEQLRAQVDALLAAAPPVELPAPLRGIVVPHAAYQYSGRAAATAYACVRGAAFARVAILAPSHFTSFRGVALLDVEAFATPLGLLPVDRAAVVTLAAQPLFAERADAYAGEHALEIQLPFVQRVAADAAVVPMLVGDVGADDYEPIAATLRALVDDRTLFIVSSDFVHYGRQFRYLPFPSNGVEPVRRALRELDMGAVACVCDGDAAAFRHYVADTGATICGRNPIGLFLTMSGAALRGTLLTYYTSLDVTGDYEHSVSYAAIAFSRSPDSH